MRLDGTIHLYCPPEHVASEMDNLIQWHLDHEKSGVPAEVEAAWLHHRFSQIHPFQDGHGRVARALATLVFIRREFFPLVIIEEQRTKYIEALELADDGKVATLINLFAALQKKSFVVALSIVGDVKKQVGIDQVIDAARDVLTKRKDAFRKEWEHAKNIAAGLHQFAYENFQQIANKLNNKISPEMENAEFFADKAGDQDERSHYFRLQIIESAKKLGYYADTSVYRAWARLVLKGESQAELLLSFHGLGNEFRGILASTMSFYRREGSGKGSKQVADITPLCDEIFQINYLDNTERATSRFRSWLEACLVQGLEMWRQNL